MAKHVENRGFLCVRTGGFCKITKQIIPICFGAIFSILTIPAYSTTPPDLPDEATCDENNLNTASGPVDIEATWAPNTIGTTWYSDGVQITGNDVPSGCTYDDDIDLPTNPTKTGYIFTGWRVVPCEIPSTLVSTDGTSYGYKNDSTGQYGANSTHTSDYNLTEDNTWGVTWSNGDKVTGIALCSGQRGDNHVEQWDGTSSDWTSDETTLTNASGEKKYCWCKATHYTANNAQQCSLSSPSWVFRYWFSVSNGRSATSCAFYCAYYCASRIQDNSSFRAAVFGQ